ncbi:glycoside hydrolase family 2 TIM barrel-domain containing protein [Pedobacter gandavensis]|uniref:glycoside hydrolase family 2 TIM barrel-domain containing protein n=1 Tax=Pedobacter gandavensis TaxID=2679963 RepID=UPI002931F08C|nr:glycoside hydrolase family 2 TIM barrel-domain containing protein [Pedobacter gandavensis]
MIVLFFVSCNQPKDTTSKKVQIKEINGSYKLYKDGKPYAIKGAAGDSHFQTLKEMGGNTIRVWDTTRLAVILDSAEAHQLTVIVGLPIFNSDYTTFYADPAKVEAQHQAFKAIVNKYKHHPSILMWCIGNELDFPFKPSYHNFYDAFNQLTDMIHQDDPDHPITTTVLNFNKKYIFNLIARCNLDLISFNVFGRITYLREDLKSISWFWNGPFMVTEWGIDGPWEGTPQTAWGAYIEDTSTKKAEQYQDRFLKYMPVENPGFLGAFAFFWGNKQEGTQSWFSMFDEHNGKSQVVDAMKYLWTGKHLETSFPQVNYMLLNEKGAGDNILLSAGQTFSARVLLLNQDKIKYVKWELYREDWYKKNNLHSDKKLQPLSQQIKTDHFLENNFVAPDVEGPYRVFATIYDDHGNFSTCNTPFYVVTDK